jgi:hypothetical protein
MHEWRIPLYKQTFNFFLLLTSFSQLANNTDKSYYSTYIASFTLPMTAAVACMQLSALLLLVSGGRGKFKIIGF